MNAPLLTNVLAEFAREAGEAPRCSVAFEPLHRASYRPPPITTADVEAAFARGVAAGRAAAATEAEAALEEERLRWRRDMDERVAATAEALVRALDAGLARIHGDIARSLADLLRELVRNRVEDVAVDALVEELRQTAPLAGVGLTLRGPGRLLERASAALAGTRYELELIADESPDVAVRLGDSRFATQVVSWMTAIEGGL